MPLTKPTSGQMSKQAKKYAQIDALDVVLFDREHMLIFNFSNMKKDAASNPVFCWGIWSTETTQNQNNRRYSRQFCWDSWFGAKGDTTLSFGLPFHIMCYLWMGYRRLWIYSLVYRNLLCSFMSFFLYHLLIIAFNLQETQSFIALCEVEC